MDSHHNMHGSLGLSHPVKSSSLLLVGPQRSSFAQGWPLCTESKAPTVDSGQTGPDHLSLDLLEAICKCGLSLLDRLALASCCRSLWAREDLAASSTLWGDLVIRPHHLASPDKRAGLLAWLKRYHAGLRRVQLEGNGMGVHILAILGKLPAGTPLAELHMVGQLDLADGGRSPVLRSLQRFTRLSTLNLCHNNLRHLPRHLSSLRLVSLDLSYSELQPGALAALQHITSLQCLNVASCSLVALPPVLSSLSGCLLELTADGNDFVEEDGQGARFHPFQPLLHLTQLRRLSLSDCDRLRALPSELSALSALESLHVDYGLETASEVDSDLEDESPLKESDAEAAVLMPLWGLGKLTRLDLCECGVQSMHCLAALPCLAELNCHSNWLLGLTDRRSLPALQPLQQATALTGLVLGNRYLHRLPSELSALGGSLAHLDLESNRLWDEDALKPFRHLTLLTHLTLSGCSLWTLPAGNIPVLTALQSLKLSRNWVGRDGTALSVLSCLSALTHLDISWCIRGCSSRLPPELSALRLLSDLNASGNYLGVSGAVQPLGSLSSLTRLVLEECFLECLPSELAALPALADLSVNTNPLGGGGYDVWQPLLYLQSLTRLDVRHCQLRRVPPQLSALGQLQELHLSMNQPLGADSEYPGFLQPLRGLTSLRKLRLLWCELLGLGAAGELLGLSRSLRNLEVLSFSGNQQLGQRGAEVLQLAELLPSLSRLDLEGCNVQGCEQLLAAVAGHGVDLRW